MEEKSNKGEDSVFVVFLNLLESPNAFYVCDKREEKFREKLAYKCWYLTYGRYHFCQFIMHLMLEITLLSSDVCS